MSSDRQVPPPPPPPSFSHVRRSNETQLGSLQQGSVPIANSKGKKQSVNQQKYPSKPPPPPPPLPPQPSLDARRRVAQKTESAVKYEVVTPIGSPNISSNGSGEQFGNYSSSSMSTSSHPSVAPSLSLHQRATTGADTFTGGGAESWPTGTGTNSRRVGRDTGSVPAVQSSSEEALQAQGYSHNEVTAALLLPPLVVVLFGHATSLPLRMALYSSLSVYGFDLANVRDGSALSVWIGFAFTSLSFLSGFSSSSATTDSSSLEPFSLSFKIFQITACVFLIFCVACWTTLQFRWLHIEAPEFVATMERLLHVLVPIVSVTILAKALAVDTLGPSVGPEIAVVLFPHIWTALMATELYCYSDAISLFKKPRHSGRLHAAAVKKDDVNDTHAVPPELAEKNITNISPDAASSGEGNESSTTGNTILTSEDGVVYSILLLVMPPIIHFVAFRRRITLFGASTWDDWCDLTLVLTVPYLVHYGLLTLTPRYRGTSSVVWWKSSLPSILRPGIYAGSTAAPSTLLRRGLPVVPVIFSVLATVAFQNRYLVRTCLAMSYAFHGQQDGGGGMGIGGVPSTTMITVYLTLSSSTLLGSLWMIGRTDQLGNLLLGEYHEDGYQALLIFSGLFLGFSFGCPLSLIAIPALLVLVVVLAATTKLFRYSAVALFVLLSALLFMSSYRLIFIVKTVNFLPRLQLGMSRFGSVTVWSGGLILGALGLVYRAPGGFGAKPMKDMDIVGIVLVLYSLLATAIESALLREPFLSQEVEHGEFGTTEVYSAGLCCATSVALILIALHLRRMKAVSTTSALLVASVAAGKLCSALLEDVDSDRNEGDATLLFRTFVSSLLIMVIGFPCVILEPVTGKGTVRRMSRKGPDEKVVQGNRWNPELIAALYCCLLLPLAISWAIPVVIRPLIQLMSRSAREYYPLPPPWSALVGYAATTWGIVVITTLKHYLPQGGAEGLRKAAAVIFLLGLALVLLAPKASISLNATNPFATISSVGRVLLNKSTNSGWGLLLASAAVLLALAGPLDIRERRTAGKKKDNSHFLRLVVFSNMFGCGVAWFVTMQSMHGESSFAIAMTSVATITAAVMGTVTTVLGYSVDVKDFHEVVETMEIWAGFFFGLFFVAGSSALSGSSPHPFGVGGWLSTYLSVCAGVMLAFSVALRSRSEKSSVTRGLGNLSCIGAWASANVVLYGKFGIASVGVKSEFSSLWGIAGSVLGTFALAPILLVLEEESNDRRRKSYALGRNDKTKVRYGINFSHKTRQGRLFPLLGGVAGVLLLASMYGVLLRGGSRIIPSGLRSLVGLDPSLIASSHEDVFASVYGSSSRTVSTADNLHDVEAMARKAAMHSKAIVSSARLAACSFWTAKSLFTPLLHLVGIVAVLPSMYLALSDLQSEKIASAAVIYTTLPLTLIPIVLCRGLPTLTALALLACLCGIVQATFSHWTSKRRRMKI